MQNGPGTYLYHLLYHTYRVASTYHVGMEVLVVSSTVLPIVREPLEKDWSPDLCQLCLSRGNAGLFKEELILTHSTFSLWNREKRGDNGLIYLIHPKMLTPGIVSG